MRLDKYFDKIYCINLDRRKDRWKETEKELKKWGLFSTALHFIAPLIESPISAWGENIASGILKSGTSEAVKKAVSTGATEIPGGLPGG